MNQSVDISIVLDRSGSMASIKDDMEGGLNKLIEDQKKIAGDCTVSLFQFDFSYETVFEGKPISEVPQITLVPRGSTALIDALGKTINALGTRLKNTADDQRPQKVIVIVITDGQENASREFTKDHIKEMVEHQKDVYKWDFVFLGANQDAIQESGAYGFNAQSAMDFSPNKNAIYATSSSMSDRLTSVRSMKAASFNFTPEDRKKQEDLKTK